MINLGFLFINKSDDDDDEEVEDNGVSVLDFVAGEVLRSNMGWMIYLGLVSL